jgi:hypothetical protein
VTGFSLSPGWREEEYWECARALEAFDGDESLARLEDDFRRGGYRTRS